jgi:two-component system OmpR family response regulator
MRVLLVEDDHVLVSAVNDHIAADGHGVDWVKRLDDASHAVATVDYGLILLDLNLPDGRGLDFLKELRKQGSHVPIMILTAQDQIANRIEGLNSGADDYMIKPFDLGELSARLFAVARRYAGVGSPEIRIGDLVVDEGRKLIKRRGMNVSLTSREWAVLTALIQNLGAIVAKSKIEDALYAFGMEVESNTVEVYVSRVRKKIGKDIIKTCRGLGYQIEKND